MQRPNILLLVMDTARADYVEDERIMPNLHEFATGGTWFSNVFANAPWTLPSHSSLFTGRYPSEHGTTGAQKRFASETSLASVLTDEGYHTAAFSNNPWISPDFGFDDFEEFVPCWQPFRRGADLASVSQEEGLKRQLRSIATELFDFDAPFTVANALYMKFVEGRYDSGAALTNYRVRKWLTGRPSGQPFFAFVNYMEPHLEYDPPRSHREQFLDEDERRRWDDVNQDPWAYLTGTAQMTESDFEILRNLYRAELHYLDARLDRLFDFLRDVGILESTVVIVTGDHGEHLGERGLMDHQYSLSDSLLRVPLVVRYPDVFDPGVTDDRLVELRDLYATIISLAGLDEGPSLQTGSEPRDLSEDDEGREAVVSEYLSPQPSIDTLSERYDVVRSMIDQHDRSLRSIRSTDRKLVEGSDGTRRLFAVDVDGACEDQPLQESAEELGERIREVLGDFSAIESGSVRRELPESNKQRLEDLGYL